MSSHSTFLSQICTRDGWNDFVSLELMMILLSLYVSNHLLQCSGESCGKSIGTCLLQLSWFKLPSSFLLHTFLDWSYSKNVCQICFVSFVRGLLYFVLTLFWINSRHTQTYMFWILLYRLGEQPAFAREIKCCQWTIFYVNYISFDLNPFRDIYR